jgi:hypothetical protein
MAQPNAANDAPTTDTFTDPEDSLLAVTVALEDGPVTFTRPGIESLTFQVKDGKISTTKERHQWLLTHVVGTGPAAE